MVTPRGIAMLMTSVRDHGVQRVATGRSKGGEEPQSLGQHVTDMGKPAGVGREQRVAFLLVWRTRVASLTHLPPAP